METGNFQATVKSSFSSLQVPENIKTIKRRTGSQIPAAALSFANFFLGCCSVEEAVGTGLLYCSRHSLDRQLEGVHP